MAVEVPSLNSVPAAPPENLQNDEVCTVEHDVWSDTMLRVHRPVPCDMETLASV